MLIDPTVRSALVAHKDAQVKVCLSCPKKGEGSPRLESDGKFHSGRFMAAMLASVRVKISCDACNGQEVKPLKGLTNHTECPRFIRSELRKSQEQPIAIVRSAITT